MIEKTRGWNIRCETHKYDTGSYTMTQLKAIYQFIFLELPSGGSRKKDCEKYLAHKDNRELISRRIMKHLHEVYTTEFPIPSANEKNVYSLSLESLVRRKKANGEPVWPKLYEHSFHKKKLKIIKLKYDKVNENKQWAMLISNIVADLNKRYKKNVTVIEMYRVKDDIRKVIEEELYSENMPLKKRKFDLPTNYI